MTKFKWILLASIPVALTFSCQTNNPAGENLTNTDSVSQIESHQEDSLSLEQMKEGLPVFYNMYLSVEMTKLFEASGSIFSPEILNKVENEKNYLTSGKKALNLGVYAVDLGYIRAYEQNEKSRPYFNAMRNISASLGIPDDFFLKSSDRYDQNISNKDSLIKIANEVYSITSKYLTENERESASAMIVLGGWIEALYIATQMVKYSDKDLELIEKVADQKYSIGSLYGLLLKHKSDPELAGFLPLIQDLKLSFEKLVIQPDNLPASFPALKEVSGKIAKIRMKIIN